ncbi:MAG: hypothetical protein K2Y14_11020 [Burkholderiales bacterium]|nr:hypothetical protein [Burkholderiales bacterium]
MKNKILTFGFGFVSTMVHADNSMLTPAFEKATGFNKASSIYSCYDYAGQYVYHRNEIQKTRDTIKRTGFYSQGQAYDIQVRDSQMQQLLPKLIGCKINPKLLTDNYMKKLTANFNLVTTSYYEKAKQYWNNNYMTKYKPFLESQSVLYANEESAACGSISQSDNIAFFINGKSIEYTVSCANNKQIISYPLRWIPTLPNGTQTALFTIWYNGKEIIEPTDLDSKVLSKDKKFNAPDLSGYFLVEDVKYCKDNFKDSKCRNKQSSLNFIPK